MPWLNKDEMPADPIGDLATVAGKISVFEVPRPELLKHIAAAIAAKGDTPSNVDYVVFDSDILATVSVHIEKTVGDCPAPDINRLHHDITQVSAERLVAIARLILDNGTIDRILPKDLIPIIENGVRNQDWKVNDKMKQSVFAP
jgi:hypothetical protein